MRIWIDAERVDVMDLVLHTREQLPSFNGSRPCRNER
jgi:hypothetical protein